MPSCKYNAAVLSLSILIVEIANAAFDQKEPNNNVSQTSINNIQNEYLDSFDGVDRLSNDSTLAKPAVLDQYEMGNNSRFASEPLVGKNVSDPCAPEADFDGDGILNGDEFEMNPEDPCDAQSDFDGDGLSNAEEIRLVTSIHKADTDGDGINDDKEIRANTNPNRADSDRDGIDDLEEITSGLNATNDDTDLDGVSDGVEKRAMMNPLNPLDGVRDLDSDGFSNRQEALLGFDPADASSTPLDQGQKEWTFQGIGLMTSTPTIAGGGLIYYATEAGRLYSVYPNGKLNWKQEIGSAIYGSVVYDKKSSSLYFGAMDGYLYSRDLQGNPKWRVSTAASILASPVVDSSSNVYIASRSKVHAFDSSGKGLWSKSFIGKVDIRSRLVISSEGHIILANSSGFVRALDAENGNLIWQTSLGGDFSQSAPILAGDGTIVIAGADPTPPISVGEMATPNGPGGMLHKLTSAGEVVWSIPYIKGTRGKQLYSSPAISPTGEIYIGAAQWSPGGSTEYNLLSYSTNGELNWSYALYSEPLSPAIAADESIYVAGRSGVLHSVNKADGARQWINTAFPGNTFGSPVIDEDGTIYLGFQTGFLQAYADDSGGPARLVSAKSVRNRGK